MSALAVAFNVPGRPVPQGSMTAFVVHPKAKVGSLPPKPRAIVTDQKGATLGPWKQEIAYRAGLAMGGLDPYRGPVSVGLTFSLSRPRSHFGAKGLRPAAEKYPTHYPDLDKLTRSVLDALKGIVIADDAQVVVLTCGKLYAEQTGVAVSVFDMDSMERAHERLDAPVLAM